MPRKPTLPIEPCEVRYTEFAEIYIYNTDRIEIGKGSNKLNDYQEKLWEIVELVALDYLTAKGRITPKNDYMKNASTFADHILTNSKFMSTAKRFGLHTPQGDDSAIRKKLYQDVAHHLHVYEMAIKNK